MLDPLICASPVNILGLLVEGVHHIRLGARERLHHSHVLRVTTVGAERISVAGHELIHIAAGRAKHLCGVREPLKLRLQVRELVGREALVIQNWKLGPTFGAAAAVSFDSTS